MNFAHDMERCLAGQRPVRIGVAVSGGSDSTALLVLLADWAAQNDVVLSVASVNHGLRSAAADELAQVSKLCRDLRVEHDILHWTDWDGAGNLQDKARQARNELIADWAQANDIKHIVLGHTANDQAETVLMRLMRGSGVDGLAAMTPTRHHLNLQWIRPLLDYTRDELRAVLTAQKICWSDDPSNLDDRFDRVQTRKVIEALNLSVSGLVETANRMRETRSYLEAQTEAAARNLAKVTPVGDVEVDFDGFLELPLELRQRLMSHCLKWVASCPYRPRIAALRRFLGQIDQRRKATLVGCVGEVLTTGQIRISREFQAVSKVSVATGQVWDGRWRLQTDVATPDHTVAALGQAGLAQCENWRQTGHARTSLLAAPGVWLGDALVAAPLAGWKQGWTCELINGRNSFYSSVLSH